MCPVCLATMGLYAAGGVSAGGITTYVASRVLRGRRERHAGDRLCGLEPGELRDRGAVQDGRRMDAGVGGGAGRRPSVGRTGATNEDTEGRGEER